MWRNDKDFSCHHRYINHCQHPLFKLLITANIRQNLLFRPPPVNLLHLHIVISGLCLWSAAMLKTFHMQESLWHILLYWRSGNFNIRKNQQTNGLFSLIIITFSPMYGSVYIVWFWRHNIWCFFVYMNLNEKCQIYWYRINLCSATVSNLSQSKENVFSGLQLSLPAIDRCWEKAGLLCSVSLSLAQSCFQITKTFRPITSSLWETGSKTVTSALISCATWCLGQPSRGRTIEENPAKFMLGTAFAAKKMTMLKSPRRLLWTQKYCCTWVWTSSETVWKWVTECNFSSWVRE